MFGMTQRINQFDKALCGIDGSLVLGSFTNEPLFARKSHIRRRDAVPLIIWNDFHTAVLVDSNARISGTSVQNCIERW